MGLKSSDELPLLTTKRIVVTGANSGLGFECAKVFAQRDAEVVLACRSEKRATAAIEKILQEKPDAKLSFQSLDLGSLKSVEQAVSDLKGTQIDLLLNNAGLMGKELARTEEGFEMNIGVNHLGHFAFTLGLIETIEQSEKPRVTNVSSVAHRNADVNLADLNWESRKFKSFKAYGQSKLANILFTAELEKRLRKNNKKTKVTCAHPGISHTEIVGENKLLKFGSKLVTMPAWKGALPILHAAVSDKVEGNEYWGPGGIYEAWGFPKTAWKSKKARNEELASSLFEKSTVLTGYRYA